MGAQQGCLFQGFPAGAGVRQRQVAGRQPGIGIGEQCSRQDQQRPDQQGFGFSGEIRRKDWLKTDFHPGQLVCQKAQQPDGCRHRQSLQREGLPLRRQGSGIKPVHRAGTGFSAQEKSRALQFVFHWYPPFPMMFHPIPNPAGLSPEAGFFGKSIDFSCRDMLYWSAESIVLIRRQVMSRTAILRQMQEDLQQCRNCGLCEGRTQAVLGAGVPNSRIVIVGEGPGRNEDEQGKPFVGRSGQLLDQMLEQVGLSRNRNVFITNIVKCRPPENRDPMPEECLACRPWLDKILELIDPKIILCVGRIAAQQLFDPNFRVTRQHGEIRERDGRLVMATFHPAALLRNPSYKPMMEEDLRKLAEIIAEEQNAQIL